MRLAARANDTGLEGIAVLTNNGQFGASHQTPKLPYETVVKPYKWHDYPHRPTCQKNCSVRRFHDLSFDWVIEHRVRPNYNRPGGRLRNLKIKGDFCAGRRMAQQAAHLVEQVLPWGPTRQWVVSVPIPLRYWMAPSEALTARIHTIIRRTIGPYDVNHAVQQGATRTTVQPGSVTCVQRCGGSSNAN
jgi:hypothetical protein